MDLTQRVPLGSTGFMVSRLGVAQGYGAPASAIEKAFHEYGINYLYISPIMNVGKMKTAIKSLAPSHRDELFIVLARPILKSQRLEKYVDGWLNKLKLEYVDLLFQDTRKPPNEEFVDRIQRLRDSGKVRFVGVSSHDRVFLGRIASGTIADPIDFFHVRYNAVHTGAEEDVFPHLQEEDQPGVVVFTATCWRRLLKPKRMPPSEKPMTAGECYRFVLTNPAVNVCLMAPSSAERLEENLKVFGAGPLTDEEMARARRIGKHIYGK